MQLLLMNNKIRNATHNIMAYRIEAPGGKGQWYVQQEDPPSLQGCCRPSGPSGFPSCRLQDFDEDGEDAAGGRLLHMLQVAACRNVCVVVSRWFGGVLLGPSRFALINNCARDLLTACGFIQPKR